MVKCILWGTKSFIIYVCVSQEFLLDTIKEHNFTEVKLRKSVLQEKILEQCLLPHAEL